MLESTFLRMFFVPVTSSGDYNLVLEEIKDSSPHVGLVAVKTLVSYLAPPLPQPSQPSPSPSAPCVLLRRSKSSSSLSLPWGAQGVCCWC
jgi:hypothetical protein